MYPHFIEVHDKGAHEPFCVNVDNIVSIGKEGIILTGIPNDLALATAESYDELKALIRKAGTQIDKRDPRLDMSIPLSMDELVKPGMIGEPVFNSNTRKWMLVADSALDNSSWVDLVDHAGKIVRFGPHEVVKYPLYRMRHEND